MRIFGEERESIDYVDRPGAYAVCRRENEVLVVREASGLFLPGGGIEPGETAREALERELLEETGYEAAAANALGRAGQYTERNAAGRAYFKRCWFFEARLRVEAGRLREPELENRWLAEQRAMERLHEEAFRWALECSAREDGDRSD